MMRANGDDEIFGNCAHEIVERQAQLRPHKIALQYEESEYITYQQLNERAEELARSLSHYLKATGNRRRREVQVMVPIWFDKGIPMVVAMLAVMKSGGAYVPLDAAQPISRIHGIIEELQADFILAGNDTSQQEKLQEVVDQGAVQAVTLENMLRRHPAGADATADEQDERPQIASSSLAYVMFTSGSTGTPKGVMVEHRNLTAMMLADDSRAMGIWTDVRGQFAPYTYTLAVLDIFCSLAWGARVVMGHTPTMLGSLSVWLEKTNTTHITVTPAIASLVEEKIPPYLRDLGVGGDAFRLSLLQHVPPTCRVLQGYGQTETTSIATTFPDTQRWAAKVSPEQPAPRMPVGYPFGDTRIYLLAPGSTEPVAPGEEGEICIGGPHVARGYLNDPALTESKFLPDPISPPGRMFRTGDLGRFQADGALVHLGRLDLQVQLRGQRIEVREIEAQAEKHPQVKSCTVVKAETSHGEFLVAFVQPRSTSLLEQNGTAVSGEQGNLLLPEVAAQVATAVPEHMVPTRFMSVTEDDLPRTSHAKIDRRALTARAATMLEQDWFRKAPDSENIDLDLETDAVRMICEVFGKLLRHPIGPNDSFLEQGGQSILAIQAATRINRELGISSVTFRDILEYLTATKLAQRAISDSSSNRVRLEAIPKVFSADSTEPAPQSFAQGRLWLLEQLHPGLPWYVMPFALRIRGLINHDALEKALYAIEERHETLRTTFEDQNGMNVQIIHPFRPRGLHTIHVDDEQSLQGALVEECRRPFDLRREAGWRPLLISVGTREHVISLAMHHIVGDGWSSEIVCQELGLFYSTALRGADPSTCLGPLPIQYRDYSVWQQQPDQLVEQERQLRYWANQLRNSQPAELLADKPRLAKPSGLALEQRTRIEGFLHESLHVFCNAFSVTPFIVLLAAFRAAHYRLSGATDATIGTPITNRNREELEGQIGLFVNTQCIRSLVQGGQTFAELVRQIQLTAADAFSHPDVPFERIVAELELGRDPTRNPLVQIMLAVHPQSRDVIHLPGLEVEEIQLPWSTRFDLELHFFPDDEGIDCQAGFAAALYEKPTVQSIISIFLEMLERGMSNPNSPIDTLPLQGTYLPSLQEPPNKEKEEDESITGYFTQQALAHPERIAVRDNSSGTTTTYAQLEQQADRLSLWLRNRDLEPETLVAVQASRSSQTVVAFLGILKAHLAYLPLDSTLPTARVSSILSECRERVGLLLIVDGHLDTAAVPEGVEAVPLETALSEGSHLKLKLIAPSFSGPHRKSLAYVMFTSGSTGRPKGVMIEHQAVVSRAKDPSHLSSRTASKTFAHMASIGFDFATWEIFVPLLNGGSIVAIDRMTVLDPVRLDEAFEKGKVRVAGITPAMLKHCLREQPFIIGRLHTLAVGGDRLEVETVAEARKLVQHEIINGYGPTENTIFSTFYQIDMDHDPDDALVGVNGIPIGQALGYSGAYVMDSKLKVVPPGIMGELIVSGEGLARGYTDPSLNENRFVTVEIQPGQPIRAYRTGDRVRARPGDGQLEFFGRLDSQVKIKGQRVELAEIDYTLLGSGLVHDAVTVSIKGRAGDETELASFVTLQADGPEQDTPSTTKGGQQQKQQEEVWRDIFRFAAYEENIADNLIGRDFAGWMSSYDGENIDRAEMNEWLEDTIKTLLDGRDPGHVLEVGFGTGMILFNILDGLDSYIGIEPVSTAAEFVRRAVMANCTASAIADRIHLYTGTAGDIEQLVEEPTQPIDLAVINSVLQYFPSVDYLLKTIKLLLTKYGVPTIFLGDIRSYALYQEFQVTKAIHPHQGAVRPDQIRRIMAKTVANERELLLDPAWFTGLADRFPHLIHHVEILPKRMNAVNELSCYRYAAVIHSSTSPKPPVVHPVATGQWVDFTARQLDREGLQEILVRGASTAGQDPVAVANIPHSKTIVERRVLASLLDGSADLTTGAAWLSTIHDEVRKINALSAIELWQIGQEVGFHTEISWARQNSQHGGLDAVFHRIQSLDGRQQGRKLFQFPTEHHGQDMPLLHNDPLDHLNREAIERLQVLIDTQLPSYMAPASIQVLAAMPLNANLKVDRPALARIAMQNKARKARDSIGGYIAPSTDTERTICEELSKALGRRVGMRDNFFSIGGHSLMAARVASQLARRLGPHQISVRDLFDHPTPASLAARIADQNTALYGEAIEGHEQVNGSIVKANLKPIEQTLEWLEAVRAVGISTDDVVHVLPCTPLQEGIVISGLDTGKGSAYLVTMKIMVQTGNDLSISAIEGAWRLLVEQQEMLRTAFAPSTQPSPKRGICGRHLLQVILRVGSAQVERVSTIQRTRDRPISLQVGRIPVSLAIVPCDDGSGVPCLELTIDHSLYDGRFIYFLIDQLGVLYDEIANSSNPSLRNLRNPATAQIPFSNFTRHLQSQDYEEALSFWREYLAGSTPSSWPIGAGLSGVQDVRQATMQVKLLDWKYDLRAVASRLRTTSATVVRAAVALTVATHSDADDIILGEASDGQTGEGFVTGPCVATHPVRIRIPKEDAGQSPFDELLQRTRDSYLKTAVYQHLGLPTIKSQSTTPSLLPFQVLFAFQPQNQSKGIFQLHLPHENGLEQSPVTFGFPLFFEVHCDPQTGHVRLQLAFDPLVLPPFDADWVMQHFADALDAISAPRKPDFDLTSLVLPLTPLEKEKLDVFTKGTYHTRDSPVRRVDEMIHNQALRTPAKIALQFEQDTFLTYQQMDDQSTTLSLAIRAILSRKYSANSADQPLIPIVFDHGIELVLGILSILKAGGAFIPIDLRHPKRTLKSVCQTAKASIIIWDGMDQNARIAELATSIGAELWTLNDLWGLDHTLSKGTYIQEPSLNSLAYVLFTSGSTGEPKGVMVQHSNLAAFLNGTAGSLDCCWTSNTIPVSSYTFDMFIGQLFPILCWGGRLCLARRDRLLSNLSTWVDELTITHLFSTPTLAQILADDLRQDNQQLPYLSTLNCGGEPLRTALVQALSGVTIWDGYGPTESTVVVVTGKRSLPAPAVSEYRQQYTSIGFPVSPNLVYILQPGSNRQVPVGAVGEVCIGGPQVARGYLGQEDLTARQFVPDPFATVDPGAVMYRTGDLARFHGDGRLELLGRIDQQVKLRGIRVDLDGIASVAETHVLVQSCGVTKIEKSGKETLVAMLNLRDGENKEPSKAAIEQHLSEHLPTFAVPEYVFIGAEPLPQTSSGKLDRHRVAELAEQALNQHIAEGSSDPALSRPVPGSLEARIAELWAQTLGIEDGETVIGLNTPFSAVGGDSLRSLSLLARFRRKDMQIELPDLLPRTTVQMQANRVRELRASDQASTSNLPHYIRIAPSSAAAETKPVLILIPPILGQTAIFDPILPFLQDLFEVILVDDPFMGKTTSYPENLAEWARFYLDDLTRALDLSKPATLLGYSWGGVIALHLAQLWSKQMARPLDSLILVDAGTPKTTQRALSSPEWVSESIHKSLRTGVNGRGPADGATLALFEAHLAEICRVATQSPDPLMPYTGKGLYLGIPEREQDGLLEWWRTRCPNLTVHILDSNDHWALFDAEMVGPIAKVIVDYTFPHDILHG